MKQYVVSFVALLTVGLTALVLPLLPASAKPAQRTSSPNPCLHQPADPSAESTLDPEAQRWLRGEANHWRDCVLRQ